MNNYYDLNNYFYDEVYGRIYKIINLLTNKIYIGQTIKSIQQRFHAHINESKKLKTYLHKAMNKYGVENFTVEEIDIAYSLDELNQKEYNWIIKENCLIPNGYNMKDGGFGAKMTDEVKQKISLANKNKPKPPEHSERMSRLHKGKIITKEHREAISRLNKGKKLSSEHINIIKESKKNKPRDDITKQKVSDSLKVLYENYHPKHFYNPTTLEKIFIDPDKEDIPEGFIPGRGHIQRNKEMSEEAKRKIGEYSKNKVWYHHKVTNQNKKFNKDDEIPEEYEKGLYKTK